MTDIIHEITYCVNGFYDIKRHPYYLEVVNNSMAQYRTKYAQLQHSLLSKAVTIVTIDEYCSFIFRVFNKLLPFETILNLEPSSHNFNDMFFKEKYDQISKFKSLIMNLR